MAEVAVQRFTRREYHAMAEAGILAEDARVELIEGEVIDMSPQSGPHAVGVLLVTRALEQVTPVDVHVRPQLPLGLGKHSEPEPDVVVVRGEVRDFAVDHPTARDVLLVVEVSPAALDYDRRVKRALYAKSGIPAYWIVDVENRGVEVYEDPGRGDYSTVTTYGVEERLPVPFAAQAVAVRDLMP